MTEVVICLIARTRSTRLPGKVLSEIEGISVLERITKNLSRSQLESFQIVVCTTDLPEDDVLESVAVNSGVGIVRGPVLSVVDRMLLASDKYSARTLVRVTADNIFTDVVLLDLLVNEHHSGGFEYSRFVGLPNGVTAEVVGSDALAKCYAIHDKTQSEYMTVHLNDPTRFNVLSMIPETSLRKEKHDLSIDTLEDLEKARSIFHNTNPRDLESILKFLERYPKDFPTLKSTDLVKLPNATIRSSEYRKDLHRLSECSTIKHIKDGWYKKIRVTYYD